MNVKYIRVIFQDQDLKWLVISIFIWQIAFNFLARQNYHFLQNLTEQNGQDRMERLCSPSTPAIIVAHEMEVPVELIEAAEEYRHSCLENGCSNDAIFGYVDELS